MAYSAKTERLISIKKLSGKAQTSNDKGLINEGLPSGVTISYETVFGEPVPITADQGANALYAILTGSGITGNGQVEYLRFQSSFIAGTVDSSGGRQGFQLKLPADYEANSKNPLAGTYPFINNQTVNITSGALQLIPPSFAIGYEARPYYGGNTTKDSGDRIFLTDVRDWYIDYFNGVFFQQDPPGSGDHNDNPDFVQGYLYIGKFLSASLADAGGGSAAGANTQVQFNDGGSAFGASSNFTFDKTTNTVKTNNLTGSLTKLADGTSYLVAGDNITITTGSNGQITISSTASSTGGSGGPKSKKSYQVTNAIASGSSLTTSNSDYTDAGNDPSLIDVFLNGQLLLSGTNAQVGAGSVDYFVSDSDKLKFGFDLAADDIINVIVASTGSGEPGNPGGSDTQVQFNDGGTLSGDSGLVFNKTTNTLTTNNLTGSLTKLVDGTSYLVAGNSISITSQSNGSILLSAPNFVFNELMTGPANGTNTKFTLSKTPTANKNVSVFVNGQLQTPATSITGAPFQDYSVTGSVVFFITASMPPEGSIMMANYTTNDNVT